MINEYAGPLVLPRREYSDAEKLAMLDRLVALEEQPAKNMLRRAIKRFKVRKANKQQNAAAQPVKS